jgi:hypothetical protein
MGLPTAQKIKKPSALRVYWRLITHFEHVRQHACFSDKCYAKGNTLIMQGNVGEHIKALCTDINAISVETIVDELEESGLIVCKNLRDDLYEVDLLQGRKGQAGE